MVVSGNGYGKRSRQKNLRKRETADRSGDDL